MKRKNWEAIGGLVGALTIMAVFAVLIYGFYYEAPKDTTKGDDNEVAEVVDLSEEKPTQARIPSEELFMQQFHNMTHQKVYASEKWGATEITEERIEEMLSILDEAEYNNTEFYRSALKQWQAGNFEDAVAVHNRIWDWQGGSVGRATRLLTEKEEEIYVNKNFK